LWQKFWKRKPNLAFFLLKIFQIIYVYFCFFILNFFGKLFFLSFKSYQQFLSICAQLFEENFLNKKNKMNDCFDSQFSLFTGILQNLHLKTDYSFGNKNRENKKQKIFCKNMQLLLGVAKKLCYYIF
jgi:hypothetical protein